ncbi:hypothetical protein QBC38DRAFT_247947 [Podospora fimiseda]|uniref:Uncharacterized protein n=1 Tax=Podospora fimiseda TaxID=252190 RepID=A0AAN7H7Q3_9PEZI|nr:hypothetical protein QBC38DRAFT_247947 [Podospora fimiseda]
MTMWIVNETSSAANRSSSSSVPTPRPPRPVVSYHRLYSSSSHHHHHHQEEFCQDTTTMERGSYNYTEVEMIERSRVRVVRSQLSQIKSAVTSRLSPGWWMGGNKVSEREGEVEDSTRAITTSMQEEEEDRELQPSRVKEISTRENRERRSDWGRESGVDWRFGGHGMSMILDAEAKNNVPELERSNYISGVRDILRGLPSDLTAAEASWILSQNIPKTLSDLTASPQHHQLPPSYQHNPYLLPAAPSPSEQPKNLVHLLALPILEATRTFLLWIGPIIWGYLRYICEEFIRLEKEHHWGQKVVWPLALWFLKWFAGWVIWIGNAFPGQMVFEGMEYVKRGLISALKEFVVEVGGEEDKRGKKGEKEVDVDVDLQGFLMRMGMMGMGMGMGMGGQQQQQRGRGVRVRGIDLDV